MGMEAWLALLSPFMAYVFIYLAFFLSFYITNTITRSVVLSAYWTFSWSNGFFLSFSIFISVDSIGFGGDSLISFSAGLVDYLKIRNKPENMSSAHRTNYFFLWYRLCQPNSSSVVKFPGCLQANNLNKDYWYQKKNW